MLDPKRIKSAIGNEGTYDITNPDITKADGGAVHMAGGGKTPKSMTPLEQDVYNTFGMLPNEDRLSILPRYKKGEGFIAPEMLYELAKAIQAPSTSMRAELSPEDAFNVALNTMGGSSVGSAPRGALQMGAAGKPPRMSKAQAIEAGLYHPVGAGKKLARPVHEVEFTRVPDPNMPMAPEIKITPEDLYKKQGYPVPWDASAAGELLTGMGGKAFDEPVVLQGGIGYQRTHGGIHSPQKLAVASQPGVVTRHSNIIQRIASEGDDPVSVVLAMSPGHGLDYNKMLANTLVQQLKSAKISTKLTKEFDEEVRAAHPEFVGVKSKKLADQLNADTSGELRKTFAKRMMLDQFQKGGFPDVVESRVAISTPEMLHAPVGSGGLSFGLMDPAGGVIKDPINPHHTYRASSPGEYLGGTGVNFSTEELFPEFFEQRRLLGGDPKDDWYAFGRSMPTQRFDQRWLDQIMPLYEQRIKELTGKKDGGGVHMAGGGQTFPLQNQGGDSENEFHPAPLQIPQKLTDLAAALKAQYEREKRSLSKPGATTDILARGVVAPAIGTPADIIGMGGEAIDWLQTKIPGLRKPASVMDTEPTAKPAMGYAPKFPIGPEGTMPYGTEYAQELMEKAGITTDTKRPLTEMASMFATPAVAAGAVKAGKVLAPTAKEMIEAGLEKAVAPTRAYAVPEDGSKLSKEEYSRMMREKYAAQNAAKQEKAVTMADLKPKEEKVPADELGLYSAAQKAAANLRRNIGTGEAFLQDIKKAPDVNPDELKYTGLEDWLKSRKTVSKQEVQDFMNQNRLKIEETQLGGGNAEDAAMMDFGNVETLDDWDLIDSQAESNLDYFLSDRYMREDALRSIKEDLSPEEFAKAEADGEVDQLVNDKLWDWAHEQAKDDYYQNPIERWSNNHGYTITGNRDYGFSIQDPRGGDLTPSRGVYDFETAEGIAQQHAIDYGYVDEGNTVFHNYVLPGGENYREILLKTKSPAGEYQSSHWDNDPDTFAHVRLQDRVDDEGRKVLYVDEMQSDWHQEGRRRGYKTNEDANKIDEYKEEYDRLRQQWNYYAHAAMNRKGEIEKEIIEKTGRRPLLDELDQAAKQDEKWKRMHDLDQKYDDEMSSIRQKIDDFSEMPPEAPFSESWNKVALKRVMNYAAKNGYDRVAFSGGKPHVDRWGTDLVAWERAPVSKEEGATKPVWRMTATEQRGGNAGNIDLENEARARNVLQESKGVVIEDYPGVYALVSRIGRGKTKAEIERLAQKVWNQMQQTEVGMVTPRETGQRKFYDEDMPAILRKYANQFKGKFGEGSITAGTQKHKTYNIDISPELKKSALKGQPYKDGGAVDLDQHLKHVLSKHVRKMADGGSVNSYNNEPDMSDGGLFIAAPAFAEGGAVKSIWTVN